MVLMIALERLSPLERAAFLLHDVPGVQFDQVAQTLGRNEAAARQLAARARKHVRDYRPRFKVSPDDAEVVASAFFAASRNSDLEALQRLFAEHVRVVTDGGGVKPSAINPIVGRAKATRFVIGLAQKALVSQCPVLWRRLIDGLAGFIFRTG